MRIYLRHELVRTRGQFTELIRAELEARELSNEDAKPLDEPPNLAILTLAQPHFVFRRYLTRFDFFKFQLFTLIDHTL